MTDAPAVDDSSRPGAISQRGDVLPLPQGPLRPPLAIDPGALFRRQQAVVAMGRRAIVPPEAPILLQDAATLIAEVLEVESSMVAELPPDGAVLKARLVLGRPDGASPQLVAKELNTDEHQSLAAYAMQFGHPVVVGDLSAEERFDDVLLKGFAIRSALAVPLMLSDRALGALIVCSREPQRLTPEDAPFAEAIGHLAALRTAHSQLEERFAEESSFASALLQVMEALVVVLDGEGQVLRINTACQQVTGFCQAELKDRPIWSALALPTEADVFHAMFKRLQRGETHVSWEGALVTKHYQQRRIRWSCGALPGVHGSIKTILVTGIDITQLPAIPGAALLAEPMALSGPAVADPRTPAIADGAVDQSLFAQAACGPPEAGLSAPPPRCAGPNRRLQMRRAFPYVQQVAPMHNGELPPRAQFREVRCHDISPSGISYLSCEKPETDLLVVALGVPPRLTYLVARVTHVTPIEHEGKQMYKIGCAYTGRAPYSQNRDKNP